MIHLSRTKEENTTEFYQQWYESFFIVWKDLSLVADEQNKALYTTVLVYSLYTTYETCKLETKQPIEIDTEHYDILFAPTDDGYEAEHFKRQPYCLKMLRHMNESKAFVYSFATGCKTIQLTQRTLNVRASARPFDARSVTADIVDTFKDKQRQDKDQLRNTLLQFRAELQEHCHANIENLEQVRKYQYLVEQNR